MLLIEDKLMKIANSLTIPEEFGCYIDQDEFDYGYSMECIIREETGYNDFRICNGVSKAVIVSESLNKVIKIPFNGAWRYEDNYDEETDTYSYGEDYFEPFNYANDLNTEDARNWDYCENELIKYEKAVAAGFGEFFPKTEYFMTVDNTPLYLQERCETIYNSEKTGTASKDSIKKAGSEECTCRINIEWTAIAIDYYGLDRVNEFYKYCKDNDLSQDLHSGNIGFTLDGHPVLIDWAGWRD